MQNIVLGKYSTANSSIADSDTRLKVREKGDPKEYKIHGSHLPLFTSDRCEQYLHVT